MDAQALKWIAILDNDQKDEDNIPLYSQETKERVFKLGQEWLIKSKRLFPDEKPAEGAGVTAMRSWMKDPANVAEMKKMLGLTEKRAAAKANGVAAPDRDKAAEQAKAAAGSALHALVFNGEGLEMTDGE